MTDKPESSFTDLGFLSSWAEDWSQQHGEQSSSIFQWATNLNRIAHNLLYRKDAVPASIGQRELYVFTTLFVRCISNFQGAVILLRKGMNLEARILVRSCLECTFMLAAAQKMGPEFITKLIKQHHNERKKIGLEIEKVHKNGVAFTDEQAATVKEIIAKHTASGTESFDFYTMAQKGGLENWYLFYRNLSNYSAHPSLDSLQYFVNENADEVIYQPNQSSSDLEDAVDLACMFLITSCKVFNEHLGENKALTVQLDEELRKTKRWQTAQQEQS